MNSTEMRKVLSFLPAAAFTFLKVFAETQFRKAKSLLLHQISWLPVSTSLHSIELNISISSPSIHTTATSFSSSSSYRSLTKLYWNSIVAPVCCPDHSAKLSAVSLPPWSQRTRCISSTALSSYYCQAEGTKSHWPGKEPTKKYFIPSARNIKPSALFNTPHIQQLILTTPSMH